MSKEQAIAFFEEISKNNKLADKVEKVVGEKNSDEAKAKELISLAQRYNFKFTQEEAASAQEALKKPLSPEEILEVSGGKINLKSSLMAMALLAGLGVGGTISNMDTNAIGPEKTVQGQSEQGGVDNDDSAEEARRMEEEGQQVAQHTRERDHVNINGTAQGANLSIFRSANPLSFTVYDGYQPRLNNRFGEAAGDRGQRMEERNIHTMQPGQAPADNSNNAMNALYQQKRTQPQFQRNFNFNSQQRGSAGGLGLKFNPSFSAMPAPALRVTPALDLEQQREKHLQKLERKQQRNREDDKPKLPVDRTERRADVERQERRPHRDSGWKIKSALFSEDRERLLQKYRTSASEASDREWIISAACAVANGVRPDLTKTLTTAPRVGFRETCAFCGQSGCVDVSYSSSAGQLRLRCSRPGCPLNWVSSYRCRVVLDSTPSVAPHKYEVERWEQLPKLIAEIDDLVARTEYDNYGNAARLRDSTESKRRAMGELLRQREEARRRREEARRQREEKLRLWIEAWQRGDRQCPHCRRANLIKAGSSSRRQYLCKDCHAENGGSGGYFKAPKETVPLGGNEQQMQMTNDVAPADNQPRHNASLSAFMTSAMEDQIVNGANSTHRFQDHTMTQPLQLDRLPQDFNAALLQQMGATNAFNSNQNRTQTMPNQMEEENSDTITDENI